MEVSDLVATLALFPVSSPPSLSNGETMVMDNVVVVAEVVVVHRFLAAGTTENPNPCSANNNSDAKRNTVEEVLFAVMMDGWMAV